ncbi:reductive dehalogenase [Dehalococcoides mccartyi]|jgi:reductive dehalogenase|uniref:reductive dehalogenase n=1 Tax=Dehalococcoides mccartyi TaxID=61435 RepID=UPI0003C87B3F|nr:reductive dehalogenase [Dehalococcoides mccartyi]AHB14146.1 reductive dehalogenase [Dehalococcoides mccartyi GY50]
MTRYHSTLNRRDFMRGLGVIGAGLSATSVTSPTFRDLDEIISSPTGISRHPWWVRENDPGKLTVEYDWSIMRNPDQMLTMHGGGFRAPGLFRNNTSTWRQTIGLEESQKIIDDSDKAMHDNAADNISGWQVRDLALVAGSIWLEVPPYYQSASNDMVRQNNPKWEGTPEEAAKMVRAAGRFYGASDIRTGELTSQESKLFLTRDLHGLPIVFEDSPIGYADSTKRVIPNRKWYEISVTIHMSKELYRYGVGPMRAAANHSRYRQWRTVQIALMNFISALGYETLGYYELPYGVIPAQAGALLFGHAEIARNDNFCISPEWGSVQGYFSLLTTLPLAQSKPIDAGISRFCNTCKKCAETCPQQCISYDDEPSWDIPKSRLVPNAPTTYTTPGKKTYHTDSVACHTQWMMDGNGCGICMGNCVFNVNSKAMIHQIVKQTVSTMPMFNGILKQADVFFGYGLTPEEEFENWWDLDFPVLGTDSTYNSTAGGYS